MTNLHETDLKNCFDAIVPTDEQKENMLQRILENDNAAEPKYFKRASSRFSIIATVCVILILTATTALAINFGWHEKLIEYFNNISQGQMELVRDGVNTPEATITKNGVTISILQTLADSNGIYVLYEIIAPDDIEFNDAILWSWFAIDVPQTQTNSAYGLGTIQRRVLAQNSNKRTELIFLQQSSSFESGYASLILRDLGYVENAGTESMDWVSLVDGEWRLEWEFTYQESKVIEVNQPVSLNGNEKLITTVVISPISVCVYIQGDDVLTGASPSINFNDGSYITYNSQTPNASFGVYLTDEEKMIYEHMLYYHFKSIINVEDVESISIGDITIPLP
ncbi:DUF4179 domain-containing protein [Dehalobacterium formicoaceticum]|uniref:DUF4179 domain-containing protein n=1 Tax=Dehalobacterium formicoaceticum TaxID=51515 RepID=A0ABT1Y1N7_9FIRM|nr:DUF4179 domain-containing protein [Dehalobacterium formicoaceticum]MCR6544105.1 DUF4179 domain-containing protein [Dehalobacterium formicoaceticum]